MKPALILLFIFVQLLCLAQSNCGNIDFEDGDTNSWSTSGNVSLVNRSQEDPYGHFPLAVSGYNSVRLGNKSEANTSSIKREITVDNANSYFIYSYSIVFLGYPHEINEASYVKLRVTDAQGIVVPCTELLEHAQINANEGFLQSQESNEENLNGECCYPIYYKPWTTVAIDLNPYVGQTLTFELSSAWCVYSVDWGYAYVDAFCSSDLIYEFTSCDNQTHFIGTPGGFDAYNWSGPGIVDGQGTNQIEINQVGTYILDIPNSDIQCASVHLEIEASIDEIPSFPEASFTAQNSCLGQPTSFTNTSYSILPIQNSSWYIGTAETGTPFNGIWTFNSAGEQIISLVIENEIGCIDTVISSIFIQPEQLLNLGSDIEICPDTKTVLKADFTNGSILWSSGEQTPEIEITYPGFYWAAATQNGCTVYDTVLVDTNSAFLGEIPNVFTPNNDLINDVFEIKTSKILLYNLTIINRWGNLVFESNDPNLFWDGKTNDSIASDDVYTYRLTYQFECMDKPKSKSGFVSLFRGN